MAVVTSSVKPETQPLQFPVKPTLSRRASAFSIDAIMAGDGECCPQSSHVTAGAAVSGSGDVVTRSPSRRSVAARSARKSAVNGQLSTLNVKYNND